MKSKLVIFMFLIVTTYWLIPNENSDPIYMRIKKYRFKSKAPLSIITYTKNNIPVMCSNETKYNLYKNNLLIDIFDSSVNDEYDTIESQWRVWKTKYIFDKKQLKKTILTSYVNSRTDPEIKDGLIMNDEGYIGYNYHSDYPDIESSGGTSGNTFIYDYNEVQLSFNGKKRIKQIQRTDHYDHKDTYDIGYDNQGRIIKIFKNRSLERINDRWDEYIFYFDNKMIIVKNIRFSNHETNIITKNELWIKNYVFNEYGYLIEETFYAPTNILFGGAFKDYHDLRHYIIKFDSNKIALSKEVIKQRTYLYEKVDSQNTKHLKLQFLFLGDRTLYFLDIVNWYRYNYLNTF